MKFQRREVFPSWSVRTDLHHAIHDHKLHPQYAQNPRCGRAWTERAAETAEWGVQNRGSASFQQENVPLKRQESLSANIKRQVAHERSSKDKHVVQSNRRQGTAQYADRCDHLHDSIHALSLATKPQQ